MIEMFPNNKNFYFALGACEAFTGHAEKTLSLMRTAAMLSPRDPVMYINYRRMGLASMLLGRDGDAIEWLNRSLAVDPDAPAISRRPAYLMLAAIYARDGQEAAARQAVAEAHRLWPFDTLRRDWADGITNPVFVAQWQRYRDGLRLAGERDHADEHADFGVPSDAVLHSSLEGYTPTTAPGVTTIRTGELTQLIDERKPVVLDAVALDFSDRSLPGAIRLEASGLGGSFTDHAQDRLRQKVGELTSGDMGRPIVAVGWNSESFDGRNLALRLVAMGYTHVYWYRGGREAWEVAGLPEAQVMATEWYRPD
jgi:rhodanese-related sulfurtransferase